MRSRSLLVLALLAGACSGGGEEGSGSGSGSSSGSASSIAEETTTTEPPEIEVPTAFRASGDLDRDGFTQLVTATVAGPERYELTLAATPAGSGYFVARRLDDAIFTLSGPDAAGSADRQFVEVPAELGTAMGVLVDTASFGPLDEGFGGPTGADLAADAIAELVFTDPQALLGDADVELDGSFDVPVPDLIADALDDLELDVPEIEALVDVGDDGTVTDLQIQVSSDEVVIEITAAFTDVGEVGDEDVPQVATDELDATPWVDEAELLAYAETPLLVPPAPPPGMALVAATVVDVFESREGCQQVQLVFAPPDDPTSEDFVEYFLIDKTCMNQFDPTPFDETTGTFPSRYDGLEVLVGTTVVQFVLGDDDFDVAAFVSSLTPVAVDVVIASVVAPPD